MISATTRLALGYTSMLVHACVHWGTLRHAAVGAALARQIQLTGVQALPIVALSAVLFGAIVPAQAFSVLGIDNEIVLKNVVWGGIRELGPLLTALVIVSRSAVAIAAEIALMRLREGVSDAVWLDAAHEEEVVIPRVLGLAVSSAVLVSYFQFIAIAAALAATALLLGTPLHSELDYFLAAGVWWQVPLSVLKGALFGLGIGAVSCYHGINVAPRVAAVPKAVVAACIGSVMFVLVVEVIAVALKLL
jgi:phospholipid/cholesterol/gamma-HCH transport system permease protein